MTNGSFYHGNFIHMFIDKLFLYFELEFLLLNCKYIILLRL